MRTAKVMGPRLVLHIFFNFKYGRGVFGKYRRPLYQVQQRPLPKNRICQPKEGFSEKKRLPGIIRMTLEQQPQRSQFNILSIGSNMGETDFKRAVLSHHVTQSPWFAVILRRDLKFKISIQRLPSYQQKSQFKLLECARAKPCWAMWHTLSTAQHSTAHHSTVKNTFYMLYTCQRRSGTAYKL